MPCSKEDLKKLNLPAVGVVGCFLYREKYFIDVYVEAYNRPKDAVIDTFDELVKCAKAVVDEREDVD